MPPIDFDAINAAVLCNARSLLQELIPGGKFRSLEYVVRNPRRDDKTPGSFKINYRLGVWKDFATGDGGSDLISLVAYLRGVDQATAARELADMLGVPFLKSNGRTKPNDLNGLSHNVVAAANEAPKVYQWGEDGPPRQQAEIRRHYYPRDGLPKRKAKIKRKSGPEDSWVTWYPVFKNGVPIGWQAKKPDDYVAIPYITAALNPFDPELKDDEILWPEGEKDVESLSGLNLRAFTFGGGGDGLPDGIGHYLKDRRLVIFADNDKPGREHAEAKAKRAHEAGAASIRVIYFPELPPKGDVSDFIVNGGTAEQLRARIDITPLWSPVAENVQESAPQERCPIVSASDLQAMTFAPVSYFLSGYIPEGAAILAGKPKIGKSWLFLDVALAATNDRYTLGALKPIQGDVLYLALEDNLRRLKKRIAKLLGPDLKCSDRLKFATEWQRADQGGLEDIEEWCRSVPSPAAVFVDTLEKFRPLRIGKSEAYSTDYAAVTGLQKIAAKFGIAILIAHHLRKMAADDPFDEVSGTLGLTAAADTIVILKRHGEAVTLYARGRDIEEKESAVQFNRHTCRWTILGEATEIRVSSERAAILQALAGAGPDGLAVSEIMAATGRNNRNATDRLLFKMKEAGEVVRVKRGVYSTSNPTDDSASRGAGKIGKKERDDSYPFEDYTLNDNLTNLTDPPTPCIETDFLVVRDDEDASKISEEMPSRAEDSLPKNRAPSEVEGTLGDEIDTSAAGRSRGDELPRAEFRSLEPEDDLTIPEYLRRTEAVS